MHVYGGNRLVSKISSVYEETQLDNVPHQVGRGVFPEANE